MALLRSSGGTLLLQQKSSRNIDGKIIFGSFSQDSDLDTIPVERLTSVTPEFDGLTIKIGEIACYLVSLDRSGNLHSRTFIKSNNDGSCVSLQQQFLEMEDKAGTMKLQEAIKNDLSAMVHFSVSETDKKSKVITKEDQPEHHQDPPPQVISQFNIPSCNPDFNASFSFNFFCKSGSEISCVALSMCHATLDLENYHSATMNSPAPPWFSTGKSAIITTFTFAYFVSRCFNGFIFPSLDPVHLLLFAPEKPASGTTTLRRQHHHQDDRFFLPEIVFLIFDPGGALTFAVVRYNPICRSHCCSVLPLSSTATPWISSPASVFEMATMFVVGSCVWISDLTGFCIIVFDPGGNHRRSSLILLREAISLRSPYLLVSVSLIVGKVPEGIVLLAFWNEMRFALSRFWHTQSIS